MMQAICERSMAPTLGGRPELCFLISSATTTTYPPTTGAQQVEAIASPPGDVGMEWNGMGVAGQKSKRKPGQRGVGRLPVVPRQHLARLGIPQGGGRPPPAVPGGRPVRQQLAREPVVDVGPGIPEASQLAGVRGPGGEQLPEDPRDRGEPRLALRQPPSAAL